MVGRTTKRSSDDCVFADTKKKKISQEKGESDAPVSNDKTSTVCDGDLRQKKAFFAYFGKSFDDGKKSPAGNSKTTDSNNDVRKKNIITKTSCVDSSKTLLVNKSKLKDIKLPSHDVCTIKYDTLLIISCTFYLDYCYSTFSLITMFSGVIPICLTSVVLLKKKDVFLKSHTLTVWHL